MKKFWSDEGGAVAVEYAILVTFIAFFIVIGAGVFGTAVNTWFDTAGASVDTMEGAATVTLPS